MGRGVNTVEWPAPFGHILCRVDGSDEACRAAEHAARMANSLGAGLSVLAIGEEAGHSEGFDEYARIEGVSEPMPPSVENDVRACLDQAMSVAAPAGLKDAARPIRTGNAATAICDAAQARSADLVVIRRRRSNLVERLLGASVPDALANGRRIAVLTVG